MAKKLDLKKHEIYIFSFVFCVLIFMIISTLLFVPIEINYEECSDDESDTEDENRLMRTNRLMSSNSKKKMQFRWKQNRKVQQKNYEKSTGDMIASSMAGLRSYLPKFDKAYRGIKNITYRKMKLSQQRKKKLEQIQERESFAKSNFTIIRNTSDVSHKLKQKIVHTIIVVRYDCPACHKLLQDIVKNNFHLQSKMRTKMAVMTYPKDIHRLKVNIKMVPAFLYLPQDSDTINHVEGYPGLPLLRTFLQQVYTGTYNKETNAFENISQWRKGCHIQMVDRYLDASSKNQKEIDLDKDAIVSNGDVNEDVNENDAENANEDNNEDNNDIREGIDNDEEDEEKMRVKFADNVTNEVKSKEEMTQLFREKDEMLIMIYGTYCGACRIAKPFFHSFDFGHKYLVEGRYFDQNLVPQKIARIPTYIYKNKNGTLKISTGIKNNEKLQEFVSE